MQRNELNIKSCLKLFDQFDQRKNVISLNPISIPNLSLFLGILEKISDPTIIPFLIISYLFRFHAHSFIEKTLEAKNRPYEADVVPLVTSCLNNVYALAIIFFGKELGLRLIFSTSKILSSNNTQTINDQLTLNYKIIGLLDGEILYSLRQDSSYQSLSEDKKAEKEDLYIRDAHQHFFNALNARTEQYLLTNNSISQTTFAKILENPQYDFNRSILMKLKIEIKESAQKITTTQSKVYCIGATLYREGEFGYRHAFMIEQFMNMSNSQVNYRLYQSWIEQITLSDFLRKTYCKEVYSWDSVKIENFLDQLIAVYCDQTISSLTCFGFEDLEDKSPLTDFKNNELTGTSIRYVGEFFNPRNCIENVKTFLGINSPTPSVQK